MPDDVQDQVDAGKLPARSAYEVSKLPDDDARRSLAAKVTAAGLTHRETAQEVRERQPKRKRKRKPGGVKLNFSSENGWKITISSKAKGNYHEVEEAILQVLDKVRLRINNNVQIY